MKKNCLFACLLLLFTLFQVQAANAHTGIPSTGSPGKCIRITPTINEHGLFPVLATNAKTGSLTYVFVRLQWENEYYSGYSLYGDVVLYFWENNEGTIPADVSDLQINFRVMGWNGWNSWQYDAVSSAYGSSMLLRSGVEHDYDDGTIYRWNDYYLLPGNYYL
jgi:hypothetical protein